MTMLTDRLKYWLLAHFSRKWVVLIFTIGWVFVGIGALCVFFLPLAWFGTKMGARFLIVEVMIFVFGLVVWLVWTEINRALPQRKKHDADTNAR